MTASRGRVLIINIRDEQSTDSSERREGSEHDYYNLTKMFEKFGFIISELSGDKNWEPKEMIQTIHDETQFVDKDTQTSVHANLGMFVLVIMCHGDFGTVLAKESGSYKHIRLVDIYRLLSPQNFSAMKGKPKMIILQACSGVNEMTADDSSSNAKGDATNVSQEGLTTEGSLENVMQPHGIKDSQAYGTSLTDNKTMAEYITRIDAEAAAPPTSSVQQTTPLEIRKDSHLALDDLIVYKPSFDDYVSYRDSSKGSIFIRTLVSTFYKQAGMKHATELSEQIQSIVREIAPERYGVGQVPVTISTFTNERKLYLSPGVNMRTTHPESLRKPVLPNPCKTVIEYKEADGVSLSSGRPIKLLTFVVKRI